MTKKDGVHFDHILPTVPLPSSDLITYRFDQTDKKLDALDKKFDAQAAIYATKEELGVITKRMDNYTWYWRAIVTGFIALIVYVITAKIGK